MSRLKNITVKKKITVKTEATPNAATVVIDAKPAIAKVKTFVQKEKVRLAKEFVKQMKAAHKASKLSLKDFAPLVGGKTRTLQSWFSGDAIPAYESVSAFRLRAVEACAHHDRLASALKLVFDDTPAAK